MIVYVPVTAASILVLLGIVAPSPCIKSIGAHKNSPPPTASVDLSSPETLLIPLKDIIVPSTALILSTVTISLAGLPKASLA